MRIGRIGGRALAAASILAASGAPGAGRRLGPTGGHRGVLGQSGDERRRGLHVLPFRGCRARRGAHRSCAGVGRRDAHLHARDLRRSGRRVRIRRVGRGGNARRRASGCPPARPGCHPRPPARSRRRGSLRLPLRLDRARLRRDDRPLRERHVGQPRRAAHGRPLAPPRARDRGRRGSAPEPGARRRRRGTVSRVPRTTHRIRRLAVGRPRRRDRDLHLGLRRRERRRRQRDPPRLRVPRIRPGCRTTNGDRRRASRSCWT